MSLELVVEASRPWPLIWSLVGVAFVFAVLGLLALRAARRR